MPKKGSSGRKKDIGKITGPEDWDRAHHGNFYADLSPEDRDFIRGVSALFLGSTPENMIKGLEWKASEAEKEAHFAEEFGTKDPETIRGLIHGEAGLRIFAASVLERLFWEIRSVAKGESPERLIRWIRALNGVSRLDELLFHLHIAANSPPTKGRPKHIQCRQVDFINWFNSLKPGVLARGDRSRVNKVASLHGYTFENSKGSSC